MAKLVVQLVTWNGEKYIPHLFNSLRNQTFKDWKLYILDNNSSDNTVGLIKDELSDFDIEYELDVNKENIGFAGGHNQLFKKTNSEYFLLLNQDLFLEKDCFEKLINFLDINKYATAVSPRLMKWNFAGTVIPAKEGIQGKEIDSHWSLCPEEGGNDNCFTDYIDSLGLKVYKNRRVVDYMTGKSWKKVSGQVVRWSGGQVMKVFGVSGALPVFRREMIKKITIDNNDIFDSSYGSYKEDVDLAYRMSSAGQKSYILLNAVAYHDRSSNVDSSIFKNKKEQSKYVKYYSYKNHLMTLYKNEYWQNFILDLPWILWYELRKFAYFLLLDRSILRGLKEVWNLRKGLKNKRKKIKEKRRIKWSKMRKFYEGH